MRRRINHMASDNDFAFVILQAYNISARKDGKKVLPVAPLTKRLHTPTIERWLEGVKRQQTAVPSGSPEHDELVQEAKELQAILVERRREKGSRILPRITLLPQEAH
jgi:hypothetical protein